MRLEGMTSGRRAPMVYAIYADTERAAYVGSTARTAYSRYSVHRGQLRGGYHHCGPLQEAWKIHGEGAFRMVKLEDVPPECDLRTAEYQWMQRLSGDGYRLYNPQEMQCVRCSAPLYAQGRIRYCSTDCRVKAWRAKRRTPRQEAGDA